MSIAIQSNVIIVTHRGNGSVEDAEKLCKALRAEVERIVHTGKQVAILHDSTALAAASEPYARVFSHCFEEIKHHRPIQVAQIDRALLRVFATVATTLARMDMKIYKTRSECVDYLRERGFDVAPLEMA